ncbi:Rpp20 subunit of nuclear RNase MRP and P-domain-containing protein [Elsinoe ampelina]|uniref:Rpp20 subunit of nuclear RNase MRP and P-domain-containing protein n=1 Tax=Elsinoe ampelina TaxID=302913 RepID=A0A6A6G442_9PEZI|nr:Rpp20 subunit of nuclear RNase MRP and P-domain-containing protein [Elsinoe ampelina]
MGIKRKRDPPTTAGPSDQLPSPPTTTTTNNPTSPPVSKPSHSHPKDQPTKLPPLPTGYRTTKRPLLRPPLPSPYSSSQKIVYVSPSTPFMSATKRVVKLLDKADKRATQSALDTVRKRSRDHRFQKGRAQAQEDHAGQGELDEAARKAGEEEGGEVVVKGTGRAIEKALGVGSWFQQRDGYKVRIKTGSIGAVDDVVETEEALANENGADGEEVPSARMRWASTVEVVITRV